MTAARRRGRLPHRLMRPVAALALVALLAAIAGCTSGTTRTTFPPLGSSPAPVGDTTARTRAQIAAALGGVGLQAVDANRAHRPPEGPLLAAAPRSVLQATLPDDPGSGFIVVYALRSEADAEVAARDHAAYISSGIGRVNFPFDSRFVLRTVGATVIFFTWSPGATTDSRTGLIEDALRTVGTEVQIPS